MKIDREIVIKMVVAALAAYAGEIIKRRKAN